MSDMPIPTTVICYTPTVISVSANISVSRKNLPLLFLVSVRLIRVKSCLHNTYYVIVLRHHDGTQPAQFTNPINLVIKSPFRTSTDTSEILDTNQITRISFSGTN